MRRRAPQVSAPPEASAPRTAHVDESAHDIVIGAMLSPRLRPPPPSGHRTSFFPSLTSSYGA